MSIHIAFLNFKGGVGKTTSVVNVGAGLAKAGKKTLVVDMDAQHNLTTAFGISVGDGDDVYTALLNKQPLPLVEVSESLFVAPNSLQMINADATLINKTRREYFLRRSLKDHTDNFDYILFDCPPSLGMATANALYASDDVKIFVPIDSEFFSLQGFTVLKTALWDIDEFEISKVFLTKYDRRKILNRNVRQAVRKEFKDKALNTYIRSNISLAECAIEGLDIFRYDKNSNGALDYYKLTNEIISTYG